MTLRASFRTQVQARTAQSKILFSQILYWGSLRSISLRELTLIYGGMILGIPYADLEFVFYILIEQRFFIKRDSKIFDRINLMNVYALKFQGVKCLSRFLLPLKVIAVSLGNGANSGLLLLGMLLINILNKYGEKMSLCGKPFYGVWIVQKDSLIQILKNLFPYCVLIIFIMKSGKV